MHVTGDVILQELPEHLQKEVSHRKVPPGLFQNERCTRISYQKQHLRKEYRPHIVKGTPKCHTNKAISMSNAKIYQSIIHQKDQQIANIKM